MLLGDTVSWAVEASEKQVSMQPNPVTTGGQFKSVASTGELGNEGLGGHGKMERKSLRRESLMLNACFKASPSPGRDSAGCVASI